MKLGSTGSVSMLSSAQKQHKRPTSRVHCVNCGAPTHWQVTGLFGCPPNVRSLHTTRCDHSAVGGLLYVYVGSFRSSSLYVTTSYYFPVTRVPVVFYMSFKSSRKSHFKTDTPGLGHRKWQPHISSCILPELRLFYISNFPVDCFFL